ncbi:MAG: hypothetical protein ACYSSO_14250, partial [Planctomycetota bacterium]
MKKILLIVIAILLCVTSAWAATENIYLSATGAGAQTGVDCANARDDSWFNTAANWSPTDETANKIDPGDIVYLCDDDGDFRQTFQFQGSGALGNVITLKNAAGDSPVIKTTTEYNSGNLTLCYDAGGKKIYAADLAVTYTNIPVRNDVRTA